MASNCERQWCKDNGYDPAHIHDLSGNIVFPKWKAECDYNDEMDCGCVYSFNHLMGYPICIDECDKHYEIKIAAEELHKATIHPLKADPETEYAFTLTMPPDYNPKKPIEEVARLIMEHGLTNNPIQKAAEWAFVKEHTEAGTPHIHGVYRTPSGRRISSKYFKRYWPLWDEKVKLGNGHKGGYHAKARSSESYKGYMEKEGVVVKNPPSPDIISHV